MSVSAETVQPSAYISLFQHPTDSTIMLQCIWLIRGQVDSIPIKKYHIFFGEEMFSDITVLTCY